MKGVDVMPQMMGGGMAMAAPAAAPAAAVAAPAEEPKKVKEFFELKLVSFTPEEKIKVIKEVRAVTGLGLKEVNIYCRIRVVR